MAKLMRLLAVFLAFGLVAASCGDDGDGAQSAPAESESESESVDSDSVEAEPVESEPAESEPVESEPTDAPEPEAEDVTITIESWRSDDQAIWDEQIIPVFEAAYPHIDVVFAPTTPLEYPPALRTRGRYRRRLDHMLPLRSFTGTL